MGALPSPEVIQGMQQAAIEQLRQTAEVDLTPLRDKAFALDALIQGQIDELLRDPPSLQRSFKMAVREQKKRSLKRKLAQGAAEMLSGFLSLPTRALFARDIYVGQNVGAMGASPSALNTSFVSSKTEEIPNEDG